jgi:hypothetical protein
MPRTRITVWSFRNNLVLPVSRNPQSIAGIDLCVPMLCLVRLQVPTRVVGQDKPLCAVNQRFFQRFDNFPDTASGAGCAVRRQHSELFARNSMHNLQWRMVFAASSSAAGYAARMSHYKGRVVRGLTRLGEIPFRDLEGWRTQVESKFCELPSVNWQ